MHMQIRRSDLSRGGASVTVFSSVKCFCLTRADLRGVPAVLQPRGEHPAGGAAHALLQGTGWGRSVSQVPSRAFLCTDTSGFFFFETLAGQRGRPRQSVLPGQRLRPQGRLRQQRGPGAGRRQRVLQLVGHPEGSLHGSRQVSHCGAPPLSTCDPFS